VRTDQDLLELDRQARIDALNVSRSCIVQAPAGSGKTELLIQRYLSLLPQVKNPEEILAITFTRKAALEMQLRVMTALKGARDGLTAKSEHEQLTLSLAQNALSQDEKENWNLIKSPGRMRIETVDAFGAGIARSAPISSGLGGAGSTLTDAELRAVYREAAAATLDYLTSDDGAATAVSEVLTHLDNNVALYLAYLARMLGSREQWLAITGTGFSNAADARNARAMLEATLTKVVSGELGLLRALLPAEYDVELQRLLKHAAENLMDAGKVEHPFVQFAELSQLPDAHADHRDKWQAMVGLLLTKAGTWRKIINKNDGFPAGDDDNKNSLKDLITAFQDREDLRDRLHRCRLLPEPSYTEDQWQVLLALFHVLPLAVGELRRLFGERGVSDHNEVAMSAGRALGSSDAPGEIALILDYQIRHLLVDEMQDTSLSQYELLRQLVSGWEPDDGRTLFCVGDPMQSIYRFRDAEVGEFLLARENGVGNVSLDSLLLRKNFRSGEHLVHWFNTVFAQVLPIQDDVSIGAISYAEAIPVEQHADEGEYVVHSLFDADADAEAEHTLGVVEKCLESSSSESVAILVRSRTQLTSLLPLLRQKCIEYQAIEIDRLTDLPEIIDVLALTRSLCHEGDRLAWLALLRGPWIGLDWHDLHALVCNDIERTVPELCDDPERRRALSADGLRRLNEFLETIAPFRQRSASQTLRDRIELAWCALGGPAILGDANELENIYRYLAVIEKIEHAGTLEDVRDLERRLDDERVSTLVTPDCRLQLMTMHKAKGLQFDHVILPALGRATRGGDREVLSWLNVPLSSGETEMIVSPVGARTEVESDALHQFIAATEKDKDRLELDRLLYVACTRAVRSLHLIGSVATVAAGESFRPPVSGSLLSRLWAAVERNYTMAFSEWSASLARSDDVNEVFVNPVLRRFRKSWQAPIPQVHEAFAAKIPIDVIDDEKAVEFYWVGTEARHAGTIVHRWLQRLADRKGDIQNRDADQEELLTHRWARELGVADDQFNAVWARTKKALDGMCHDPKGQWLLAGEGHTELALTGVIDGQPESVVIDRIRIDENGVHWIVDYKTSTHEGGNLQGFLHQESDRYRPQLSRYAAIYAKLSGKEVRTALYFPLLREFCEVEP
jgi:ATP-dependent helicase/nuclease subunit A